MFQPFSAWAGANESRIVDLEFDLDDVDDSGAELLLIVDAHGKFSKAECATMATALIALAEPYFMGICKLIAPFFGPKPLLVSCVVAWRDADEIDGL